MKLLLILSILTLLVLAGCVGTTEEATPTPPANVSPTPEPIECNNYYYFDDAMDECDQKEFCGMFMYQSLRTFSTLEECEAALPIPEPDNPNDVTYVYLKAAICNINNVQITLQNNGPFDSGTPLMRLYEAETETLCMEFELPNEIFKNSQKQYTLQNSEYEVTHCEFVEGNYRLEMVEEPNTGMVVFQPIEFSC